MQRRELSQLIRNVAAMAAVAVALSGCLMEDEADSDANTASDNELAGSVGDGPIIGAEMRISRNDGESLAELRSDENAGYNIVIRTKGRYYPLTIDARDGIDLVTGQAPDFVLLGAALEPGRKSVANINPFSTIAVETAREMPGGVSKENLSVAESYVNAALNNGLSSLASTGTMTTRIDASNIAEIVKASEALGESMRRTRNWLQAFGRSTSAGQVIRELASDSIDEVIDGRGGQRIDARTAAIYSIVAVQVLLETAANELHVDGVDATLAMNSAIDHVLGSAPSAGIDDLTVTAEMLDVIRVGLAAADEVAGNSRIAELRTAVDGIQPGMDFQLVRTLLPDDYRQTLDDVLTAIGGNDDSAIDTINDVVRNGGTPSPTNTAPTISGTPSSQVAAGSAYSFTPTASDADGNALDFSITGLPSWASFNTSTGELAGTPTDTDVGTYNNISITVSDGTESATLGPFSITVTASTPSNVPPTISGTPLSQVDVGSAYSFTPTADDADGDPLNFGITNPPSWTSFNSSTGELFGTPGVADVGIHGSITITVSDGEASDSLGPFSIEVIGAATNTPPTVSGTPPSQVDAGSTYSFTPAANDVNGDTLTFSITNQPSWASFSTTTGTLSGTPADTDVGDYSNITITVSDGTDSATLGPFSITVNPVTPGSVTLSWAAPTENEDGTPLTDLAGYRIYWGTTPGTYTDSVTLDNPGLTSYVVENLVPGTYEFVATSYDATGAVSVYSNRVTKVVQ